MVNTWPDAGPPTCPSLSPPRGQEPASWAQIHQKLRDFSRGTQVVGKAWLGTPSSHFVLPQSFCPPHARQSWNVSGQSY